MLSKQLAFHFDQKYCIGCKTCQTACKDKNNLEPGQFYRKVSEFEEGSYVKIGSGVTPQIDVHFLSISCNHCLEPACVKACPTGAMEKLEEDGIVRIEQDKCIGCRKCERSCPYNAPQYLPQNRKVGKCDFCLDLLKKDQAPACVSACPMRVLDYGPLTELRGKTYVFASTNHDLRN